MQSSAVSTSMQQQQQCIAPSSPPPSPKKGGGKMKKKGGIKKVLSLVPSSPPPLPLSSAAAVENVEPYDDKAYDESSYLSEGWYSKNRARQLLHLKSWEDDDLARQSVCIQSVAAAVADPPATVTTAATAATAATGGLVAGYRSISQLSSSSSSSSSSLSTFTKPLDLNTLPYHQNISKLSVFLSSTFTDTKIERRILCDQILPRLKDKSRKYGVITSVFDIRNGYCSDYVDDNTRSHKAWECTRDEIDRCFDASSSPFFLTTLGDKYGRRLIPRVISKLYLDAKVKSWEVTNKPLAALTRVWYILDENCSPNPCYVLRPFGEDGKMSHFLSDVLPKLREGFAGLAFENQPDIVVGSSIVDWETKYFIMKEKEKEKENNNDNGEISRGQRRRSFWVCRELDELPDDDTDPLYHFIDAVFNEEDNFAGGKSTLTAVSSSQNSNFSNKDINDDDDYASVKRCDICQIIFDDERKYKIKGKLYCHNCFMRVSLVNNLKDYLRTELKEEEKNAVTIRLEQLADLGISLRNLPNGAVEHEYGYLPAFSNGQLYMDEWEETVQNRLDKELDALIEETRIWQSGKLNGFGARGDDMNEILLHHHHARNNSCVFFGRSKLLQSCLDIIESHISSRQEMARVTGLGSEEDDDNNDDNDDKVEEDLGCVSLGISGSQGMGKTALISKIYVTLQSRSYIERYTGNIPVIIRFCGLSDASADSLSLMRSICIEIMLHYKLFNSELDFPTNKSKRVQIEQDDEYREAVKYFHSFLSRFPVTLFLASVDRLKNVRKGKKLSFLAGLPLHTDSRIIVSSSPFFASSAFCNTKVAQIEVGLIDLAEIEDLKSTIDGVLCAKFKRRITEAQMKYVLDSFSSLKHDFSPSMIYVSITAIVLSTWRSFDRLEDISLAPSLKGVIFQIFDNLCKKHGTEFVRHAIGFITFSLDGVNDNEMQDLLSMSDKVMKEIKPAPAFLYFSTQADHVLPFHIWSKLFTSLRCMILEKSNSCLRWNHDLIQATATEYFSEDEKFHFHHILGIYFGDLAKNNKKFKVAKQPLHYWFNSFDDVILHRANPNKVDLTGENTMGVWAYDASINERRCFECVHHFIEAKMFEEAANEVCNLDGICARSKANMLPAVLQYLDQLSTQDLSAKQRINHYRTWIQDKFDAISSSNPVKNIVQSIYEQPLDSVLRSDLRELLASKYKKASFLSDMTDTFSWIQSRHLEGALPTVSNKDSYNVSSSTSSSSLTNNTATFPPYSSISISFDGKFIAHASGSTNDNSVYIWDAELLNCTKILTGHSKAVISVAFMRDNKTIISGSDDADLRAWDICTGLCTRTFKGHVCGVFSIFILDSYAAEADAGVAGGERGRHADYNSVSSSIRNNNNVTFYSGSKDRTVRCWDLDTGTCMKVVRQDWDVTCICVSIDGLHIVSGSEDNTVRVLEVSSLICVKSLGGHVHAIYAVFLTRDKSTIVSGSHDKTVRIWDFVSGACTKILRGQCSPVFSKSNLSLPSKSNYPQRAKSTSDSSNINGIIWSDSTVKVWSTCLRLSSDDSSILIGTDENSVEFYDIKTGALKADSVRIAPHNSQLAEAAATAKVTSICLSEDGLTLVSASTSASELDSNNSLRIWDKHSPRWQRIVIAPRTSSAIVHLSLVAEKEEKDF